MTCGIDELKEFANAKATECMRDCAGLKENHAYCLCLAKLERYQLEISDNKAKIEVIRECATEKFWFRKLKDKSLKTMEQIRRQLHLVNKSKSTYCSDDELRQFKWEEEQRVKYMSNKLFCNASGEYLSMLDAYNSNVSNPRVRRSELMVRIKGTEEYSKLLQHKAWFYTITTPSKYHSHYKSGKPNPKYENFDAQEANEYLNKQWRKSRAQFDRENIKVYGIRVVEPHHDGTPHWHLMLFMEPNHSERVTQILKEYAFEYHPDENGAHKNRFKAEEITSKKGSAQSYISKYISKNIDGEFIDTDFYGNNAKQAAIRIRAWASRFKIRQFQFFGLPSVSLWRQLRKTSAEIENAEINELRNAADSSDWLTYLIMMGGTNIKRIARPFAIEYENQVKELFSDLNPRMLSKHAFNRKAKSINSKSGAYPIPKSEWFLVMELPDRINSYCTRNGGSEILMKMPVVTAGQREGPHSVGASSWSGGNLGLV